MKKIILWALASAFSMLLAADESKIELNALNYRKAETPFAAEIAATGNLGTVKNGKPQQRSMGTFEYEFTVPRTAWYSIQVPGAREMEFDLNQNHYGYGGDFLGNFRLTAGRHTLRIAKRNWFHPWNDIRRIIVTELSDSTFKINARGIHFVHEGVIRKGGKYEIAIIAESPHDTCLTAILRERGGNREAGRVELPIAGGKLFHGTLSIPGERPGIYDIDLSFNGQPLKNIVPRFSLCVIDTTPYRKQGEPVRKLIQTIDCATQAPDYEGGGTSRIVRKSFGAYRETGPVGWLTHMNANDPSYFAYKLHTPEAGKQYLIEIDYPDDAFRTYAIAFRNANQTSYPMAGGVETGHDYPLSNTIKTHTILGWARSQDSRLLIANAGDGIRGAASAIRVYKLPDQQLPRLLPLETDGRNFANWYEEGSGFVGLYGGDATRKNAQTFIPTADRWANTMSYMGCNVLYPTLMVYQFGLNPSRYNPFATPATTDLAEILLLTAEKYGMKVMFDFHPEARELGMKDNAADNKLRTRTGEVSKFAPMHGPLHPRNRAWLRGMVAEFVERYKHSPAFIGLSLRHMTWFNHALNNFHDLTWGYDDYTVGCFERETGIRVPSISGIADPTRFERRYQFLTTGETREKWIRWRCEKIAKIYRDLAKIVRDARPDLILRSDVFTREGGVDPALLSSIPNVQLNDDAVYGRRGRGEQNRIELLRKLLRPVPQLNTFSSGASYFEATGAVIPPSQLGFPKTTRATWMSAVVNPAGRLMLERFALALARTDAKSLQDGGNAYTVGQPELRAFLAIYRTLPTRDFAVAAGADDPVTVRQNDKDAYLVNMLPFAVVGRVDGHEFKLDAYELKRFIARAPIRTVAIDLPQHQLEIMEEQLAVLQREVAKLTSTSSLRKLVADVAAAWQAKQYWRFRTLLDIHAPQLDKAGILLPDFYHDGLPVTPEDAIPAEKLGGSGTLIASDSQLVDWKGEKILSGKALKFSIAVPAVGNYQVRLDCASGGRYGSFRLLADGKEIGTVHADGKYPSARTEQFTHPIPCRNGKVELSLLSLSGRDAGISSVRLTPVYTVIPPMRWRVSANYPKQNFETPLEPERKRNFNGWKQLEGFSPFVDLSLGAPRQSGTIRYAVTFIHSPDRRQVRLLYGVDYWSQMWLNGNPVKLSAKRLKEGTPSRGEEFLDVVLDKGWNELLLKIGSGAGGNGFWMELSNLDDLRFAVRPYDTDIPCVAVPPEGGRMLVSCDFEKKVAQTPTTRWDGSGEHAFTGKGALCTGNYFSGSKEIVPGKTYALQVYAKAPRDGLKTQLQINWNGPNGLIRYDLVTPATTTEYSLKRLVAQAPVGATNAFLILGRNQKIWLDDMWFGEVPENTPKVQ